MSQRKNTRNLLAIALPVEASACFPGSAHHAGQVRALAMEATGIGLSSGVSGIVEIDCVLEEHSQYM